MRILATLSLALLLFVAVSCGGSSSAPQNTGPLNGNWQLNLTQDYPLPQTALSAGGFVVESNNTLSGSVQGPVLISSNQSGECGGVGPLNGTVSGQNVTFSLNPGATVFNFTGVISSDNQSMSGSYQALGGGCLANPTSGTWTAVLVPPLNGNFTGMLTNSNYMSELTGVSPAAPILVSGSFSQSSNAGASNATLTGTINAVGYPCFATATLTGSISGQNVIMDVYGYNGNLIGFLGTPAGGIGQTNSAATVVVTPNGISLTTGANTIFNLGEQAVGGNAGPCPALPDGRIYDSSAITLNFQ